MHRLAWLPIPLLLALILGLSAAKLPVNHESPLLLLALNLSFSAPITALVAYLAARGFAMHGTPGLLLLGVGVILWGGAGVTASILHALGSDVCIASHNLLAWLSALFHLTGALLGFSPDWTLARRGWWIGGAYTLALGLLVLVVVAVPEFFIEGGGGTPPRQLVLSSAIGMFLVSALLLLRRGGDSDASFNFWYALALVLIAVGLLGHLLQTTHGDPSAWIGRLTQILGSAYMLVAALAAIRAARERGGPLALEEVTQRFEDLFELVGDGILVHEIVGTAQTGRFLRANGAIRGLLGYRSDELSRLTPLDILAPEDLTAIPRNTQMVNRDGLRRHEKTLIAKDGRRIPVEVSTRQYREHGRDMVISMVRDISERRRAEDLIQARLRLLELAADGDLKTLLRTALDAIERLAESRIAYLHVVGEDQESLSMQAWSSNALVECQVAAENGHAPIGQAGIWADAARQREAVIRNNHAALNRAGNWPEGHVPLVRELAVPVLRGGRVVAILGVGNKDADYTPEDVRTVREFAILTMEMISRIQAEEALRQSEERHRFLYESMPQGVLYQDGDGRILAANPAASRILGLTPDEPPWRDLDWPAIHENGEPFAREEHPAPRALASRRQVGPLVMGVHPPGRSDCVWIHVRAVPQRRGPPRGSYQVATLLEDITERRRVDQALLEADRRKDEFLAMLAHELRNPLAPIGNAVEIMGMIDIANPRLQWVREVIDRQVTHLTRLVDDLLNVSRIVRGKITLRKTWVELGDVVDQALESVYPRLLARGHDLTLQLPPDAISLRVDPARLVQVLTNLLDNAIKYSTECGEIELGAALIGDEVEIRVQDHGVGIPAALLPSVFDLFQQGERTPDRAQGGLGIGLTMVARLVELHGGRVEAASPGPGRGATFSVRLPLDKDLSIPVEPTDKARPGPGSLRVLVVDDEPDIADTTAFYLQVIGHQVRTAYSGEDAVREARAFRPRVVVLDIGLKGMDGYQVAGQLRQLPHGESMRLVAVTGYGDDEARVRSRAAGIDEHLVKPVEPRRLFDLLAALDDISG